MWEPPRITRAVPSGGPSGSQRRSRPGPVRWKSGLNQSAHHSHTLPTVLWSPKPFGRKAVTGAVPRWPSAAVFRVGNTPCQMLHRCRPPGVSSSPHG